MRSLVPMTGVAVLGAALAATGCDSRPGTPSTDASSPATTRASVIDTARATALRHAHTHKFPPVEISRIMNEDPIINETVVMPDGTTGRRLGWLSNGKGRGWWVHVVVDTAGDAQAVGGFVSE